MSFTKTYFLCPTSDFIHPPPAGPLCLGSIIRSTSALQYPLNRANIVAVADAVPPVVETDWKKTISIEKGLGLGAYARLREPKQRFAPVVSLFLVTSMKLVKGARIKYSALQSTTATWNIGIDVTALGTTIGPKGHWINTNDDGTEFNRESEFVFAFRVKRLKFGRRLKVEEYNKGAFLAVGGEEEDDESVLVEDVDGSVIMTAKAVPDVTENGSVYCVPA